MTRDWSSDVCSSDLHIADIANLYYNLGDAFSALQYAEEEMRLNQQCADRKSVV